MQIEVTSENAYARKLNVTVPASTVSAALERAFRSVSKVARIRGFRAGKVPRSVIEAQFGPRIKADVAQDLIQEAWTTALTKHELEPVSRPALVDQGEVTAKADFSFTIAIDVKPSISSGTYEGLEVYWPQWKVEKAEVEEAMEQHRQQQSRLVSIEDRPVEAGDMVQVELTALDGEEQVLHEPGTLVRVDDELWLKGIEPHLMGLAIGDDKTAEITFADDARTADVAGKTLSCTVKVLAIQAMAEPELDDTLAEELGYEGGVKGMRKEVKAELEKGREDQARNQARANLLQALIDANPFEVPEGMIEQNLELLMQELKLQAAYRGQDPNTVRFTQAQVADLRQRSAFAAKGALLLEFVSSSESIEVSDDDIEAKYQELADERGQTIEQVRGYFTGDGAVDELRQRIQEEKTLDFLLDKAKVTHKAPEPVAAPAVEAAPAEAAPAEAAPAEAAPKAAKKSKKKAAEPAPEEAAPAAGGTVEIDGKTYSANMVATVGDEGSTIDQAKAEALMAVLEADGSYDDLEKSTMKYLRAKYTWDEDADSWFRTAQRKWAAKRRK